MIRTHVQTDNPQLKALWQRLEEFDLDATDAAMPFSSRLSRENRWSYRYTFRTIEEYKRYLYLCVAAGQPVCPSEQIDQVWHLHLVYTKSYWDDLCANVLRSPLHHNPTEGGPEEADKHRVMYEKTLSTYQTHFGEEPPSDIWPPSEKRFGEDVCYQRVNVRNYWLVPKLTNWFRRNRVVQASCALVPLAGAVMYPWNLKGPEFLQFYWTTAVAILVLGFLLRVLAPYLSFSFDSVRNSLGAYEAACLSSKRDVIVSAVIAKMKEAGYLTILEADRNLLLRWLGPKYYFQAKSNLPDKAKSVEVAAHQVASQPGGCTLSELKSAIQSEAKQIRADLRDEGLLLPSLLYTCVAWLPLIGCISLFMVGLTKIQIGLQLGKPVEFLIMSSCIIAFFTWVFYSFSSPLTKAGQDLLHKMKAKHFRMETLSKNVDLSPQEAAMTVALFSGAAVSTGVLSDYPSLFRGMYEQGKGTGESWQTSGNTWTGCGGGAGGCGGGCGGGGCGGGCGGCS